MPPALLNTPTVALPGLLLQGRYRIVREIGRGAQSIVHQARDNQMGRDVAIKELHLPQTSRQRLRREVDLAREVSNEHCVPLRDCFEEQERVFVVSDYLATPDLATLVARTGARPADEVAAIGRGIALALRAAHRAGVLHRHVTPWNVLVESEVRARLTDLGTAGFTPFNGDRRIVADEFHAPEIAADQGLDPRADIYSLGLTLFFGLTGQLPERPGTEYPVPALPDGHRPSAIRKGIPVWLDDAIARATTALPADRFPSATRMLDALTPGEAPPLARAG